MPSSALPKRSAYPASHRSENLVNNSRLFDTINTSTPKKGDPLIRTKSKAKSTKKASRGIDVCNIELLASYTDDIKLRITATKRNGCIHLHIEDCNDNFHRNPYISVDKSGKPVYHAGCTFGGQSGDWPEGNVILAALARSKDYRTYLKETVYPFFDGVINGK